jgi:hypothetical protein
MADAGLHQLILAWKVEPGQEGAVDRFLIDSYIPLLLEGGIGPLDLWRDQTKGGRYVLEGLISDPLRVHGLFGTQKFKYAQAQLLRMVSDLNTQVLQYRGGWKGSA